MNTRRALLGFMAGLPFALRSMASETPAAVPFEHHHGRYWFWYRADRDELREVFVPMRETPVEFIHFDGSRSFYFPSKGLSVSPSQEHWID